MVDVVGIRFVAEGQEDTVRALREVNKEVQNSARAMSAAERATQTTTAVTTRNAAATRAMGDAHHNSSRNMNATGVAVQQAGYQIGDFLVQIQSGTNAMVAFGQQATQLVGVLPMFGSVFGISGTALVSLSAGLGIAIPLITAVGAYMMRTSDAAAKASDGIDRLSKAVSSYRDAVDSLSGSQAELNKEFGRFVSFANLAFENLRRAALEQINGEVRKLANNLTDVSALMGRQIPSNIALNVREFLNLNEGIKTNNRLVAEFVNAQIQLAQAKGFDAQASAAQNLLSVFDGIAEKTGELTDEQLQYRDALVALLLELSKAGAATTQSLEQQRIEALKRYTELRAAEAEAAASRQADVNAILASVAAEKQRIADRMRLAQLEREYGAESLRYRDAAAAIEERIYRAQLTQNGILGNNQEEFVAAARAMRNMEDASVSVLDALERITGIDLARAFFGAAGSVDAMNSRLDATLSKLGAILSAIGSIGFDIVGARAETAALKAGKTAAEARVEGTYAVDVAKGPQTGLAGFANKALASAKRFAALELTAAQAENAALVKAAGGGGGSAQELATLTSITEAMLVRIERERELLGLTGEARRAKEIQLQIEEQLRQSGQTATEEAIQNAAAKIAAEEAVNETLRRQQEQMQQIGQVMENALTSAFMSIVDGTKSAEDAFKDMARAIIAELFKVLVVQQLVGQFKSGGGGILGALAGGLNMNANGNAFMGGNVVPFARGGVVGSPTMFPMAGGRTGLMGEAGPEAIMPLKRGKDGKLGVASEGGGTTTVNNYFNVSANGDESVKRIVAQQVPAIAEATKAAVIDARQRGGKMRATFR